jgi:hypothetical protein
VSSVNNIPPDPNTGNVDLGTIPTKIKVNGVEIAPNPTTGITDIGSYATKTVSQATYALTWAQVAGGLLPLSFPDICSYPISSGVRPILNIGGDTTFTENTDYTLAFNGLISGTNLQIYDLNTANAFKRRVNISSPAIGSLTLRTMRCQCLGISTWINTKYVYIATTTFDTPTIANWFYEFSEAAGIYVYIGGATFPSAAGLASGLFNTNVGTTVAYAGPIPSFWTTPVPGTKYIKVQLGSKVYIKNAWAIDASNIDTDGTGTVVVAGKQIVPTFNIPGPSK